MPKYECKIARQNGETIIEKIDGADEFSVADAILSRGDRIIYIREIRGMNLTLGNANSRNSTKANQQQKGRTGILNRLKGINIKELSLFTNQFGTMLNSGLSLSRTLSVLKRQTQNAKLIEVIEELENGVRQGNQLSDVMKKFPDVFSPLYISMVKAGETSGNLGQSLITMSGFLERDNSMASKMKGAMTYPIMVLGFSIAIVLALFIFVIPTFKGFLTQLGAQLPFITNIIFAVADFLLKYLWLLALIIIGGFIAYRRWSKTPQGRRVVDNLKLKIPVISELTLKSAMARFSDTFSTLFSAGIPIISCLETVRGVLDNVIIAEKVDGIISDIKKGESLSVAIEKSGMFTPMVYDMTAVGEESGSLDKMLRKVAEFYNEEVDGLVDRVAAMVNPIMMVFVGLIVGGTLIGLYLPIFQMASYIQ